MDITRCQFIGRAVAASAAFAVPNILTRLLFAATRPNGMVNVALIGCGNIGSNYHIGYLSRMADVRIVAVAGTHTRAAVKTPPRN